MLLYFLFAKFSPMISIWEYEEGLQVARRHKGELPEPAFAGQIVPGDVHPGHWQPLGAMMTSNWCLARFSQPNDARLAIRRLIQEGVQADAMEVMSSQPIHGEPFLPDGIRGQTL